VCAGAADDHPGVVHGRYLDCGTRDQIVEPHHTGGGAGVEGASVGVGLNTEPAGEQQEQDLQHHEPDVYYISKGKDHKKYEFGFKSSIVITNAAASL